MSRPSLHRLLPLALVAFSAGGALAQSGAEDATAPDFSGFFRHNTSTYTAPLNGMPGPLGDLPGYERQDSQPWVGDHLNPLLREETAAEVRRLSELELAGGVNLASFQLCELLGVPLIHAQRENIQLLQEPDKVTIMWQRDRQVRHVFLNVPHTENPAPSWYGESVGHYEGDTLVVDTIAQNGKSRVDRYGNLSSEQLHVSERYSLIENGDALQVEFTVTDPAHFTTPWSARQIYRRSNTPWEEVVCAENNRDAQTGVDYVGMPVDSTPDF